MKKIILLFFTFYFLFSIFLPVLAQENVTGTTRNVTGTPSEATGPTKVIRGDLAEILTDSLKVKAKNIVYQVRLTDKTNYVRKFGGKSKLSEFGLGDTVQVVGKQIEAHLLEAKLIRDISIQKRWGSFEGEAISLNTEQKSFVLKPKNRKEQTVFVSETTKITKNGKALTFNEISVGNSVNVHGIWNTKNNTIMAEKIIVKVIRFNIQGKITAVDAASNTIKVLVSVPKDLKDKELIITLSAETKILKVKKPLVLADLAVNDQVTIKGIKEAEVYLANEIVILSPKKQTIKGIMKQIEKGIKKEIKQGVKQKIQKTK